MAKSKTRRKYNPAKRQHQQLSANLDKLRATTFYYHGDQETGLGASCGNCEYEISTHTARQILNMKNRWSVMFLAFLDTGLEQYVKTTCWHQNDPISRDLMQTKLNEFEDQWRESHSKHQLISVGWFMVPDNQIDLDDQRTQIIEIFESEGADNHAAVQLSTFLRCEKLTEEQEAA